MVGKGWYDKKVNKHCLQTTGIGVRTLLHLRFPSLCLLRCLHLFAISDRRFNVLDGSLRRISSFSLMHKSHFRVPHLYGLDWYCSFHLILEGFPSSFSFQMYELNVVPVWFLFLMLLLCPYHLSLNSPSCTPRYPFSSKLSNLTTLAT